MACNSCSKPYTLFRKEKGCPGCGFSYCAKCLDNKIFLKKVNSEVKVCGKCKKNASTEQEKQTVPPPDAYYKRIGAMSNKSTSSSGDKTNDADEKIRQRLQSLKEKNEERKGTTDEEIQKRLQGIKGPQPTTTDAELQERLANLRGIPNIQVQNKPLVYAPDTRTEQEQANDLMKQYLEQANIDTQYSEGFNRQIGDIEARMMKLKGTSDPAPKSSTAQEDVESEDEETTIRKIIEKAKAASLQDDDSTPASTNDELPFCEICNEDATMRCLGCRYLFCKQCFREHKDDDDGCNRYEPYKPPKNV